MPIITMQVIENVFDGDQKKELITKLTDAVDAVYPGIRDVTFVAIEEIKEGNWGIGGTPLDHKAVEGHAQKSLGG